MSYNIIILGSGGREHSLALKISKSAKCNNLYIAPGNAGTENCGVNINLDILDFDTLKSTIDRCQIDYVIVGPEAPLVNGIYDYFKDHPVHIIGPSKIAASLEGSKSFANDFMKEFKIPTADYKTFQLEDIKLAHAFIDAQKSKIVLKADGLAAGKGVLIIDDKEEAKKELQLMLEGKFGNASSKVVIEEFLDGIEFSVFVVTDGSHYKLLPTAKDYKRIGENDTGLNTGGMGAVSPVPFVDDILMQKVTDRIIEPTIEGLKTRGYSYTGFIFFGLILVDNEPYVIEYNCRLGDPETEVIIPRIENDFMDIIEALTNNSLDKIDVTFNSKTAATIMLVSEGYPEAYDKGKAILIDQTIEKSTIFHSGTKQNKFEIVTNGGRVMAVTSFGDNHKEAVKQSLESINKIHFEGMNYRKDIGFDL